MFQKFKNRIILEAILKAETALYIGAGQDSYTPLAVQGCIIKNAYGMPYIPGSSIKGILRSFLESVVENCCEHGKCNEGLKKLKNRKDKIAELEKKPENEGKNGDALLAGYIMKKSCIACRLFGSNVMAGKIKIADASLNSLNTWISTEYRTGNAIDRDTHTAASKALFDTETIPAGTEFCFRMIAENLTIDEAECIGKIMNYFAEQTGSPEKFRGFYYSQEVDDVLENSRKIATELNISATPVIIINGKRIDGFNPALIDRAIANFK